MFEKDTLNLKPMHIVAIIILVAMIVPVLGYVCYAVHDMNQMIEQKYQEQNDRQRELDKKINKINEDVNNISTSLEETNEEVETLKQLYKDDRTAPGELDKKDLKDLMVSNDTNLKVRPTLTVEDMNYLISAWDNRIGRSTGFTGQGAAFIKAAKKTGYNPVYLFAHAAVESAWGQSDFAVSRGNFYGINAVDTDPNRASYLGNSTHDGLINGAEWINANFYKNGYTTLSRMESGNYATDPKWAKNIIAIMNASYTILADM